MNVSECGCRAVYTACLKKRRGRGLRVHRAQACVYLESCSVGVAALIQNNISTSRSKHPIQFQVVLLDFDGVPTHVLQVDF